LRVAFIQNVPIHDHRMVHTDGVACELVKMGHEVDVYIQKSDRSNQFHDLPYELIYVEGETYSVKGQVEFCRRLAKKLGPSHYDVFHTKNPFSSLLPILLTGKNRETKTIYDVRGLWVDFGVHRGSFHPALGYLLNKVDIYCMNQADAVIAISEKLRQILSKRGVRQEKVEVIVGDGAKTHTDRRVPEEIRELRKSGPLIGYIGTISVHRCSQKIIESFKHVVDGGRPDARLLMIGPIASSEQDYFNELVEDWGLKNRVKFLWFDSHDDALAAINAFDVAVAYHEGDQDFFSVSVPTKVQEYMAAGRPIVTTNQSMYRNLLEHDKTGYMTEQNPESFAKGILRVLGDDILRDRIAEEARDAAAEYSFRRVAEKVESLYRRIMD
jgi:1,2-diacylglycerol 3-alpha-glucosyltransferase